MKLLKDVIGKCGSPLCQSAVKKVVRLRDYGIGAIGRERKSARPGSEAGRRASHADELRAYS